MDIGELRYTKESAKGVGCCFSTPPIYLMSRWLNAGEAGLCRRWPLLRLHQRQLYSCTIPHTHTDFTRAFWPWVVFLQIQITSDQSVVLGWRHFLSEFTHALILGFDWSCDQENLYPTVGHFVLFVLCKLIWKRIYSAFKSVAFLGLEWPHCFSLVHCFIMLLFFVSAGTGIIFHTSYIRRPCVSM